MFSNGLKSFIKSRKFTTMQLSQTVYGDGLPSSMRRVRRLANGRTLAQIDDVIAYARALDVDAGQLAFEDCAEYNGYVEVSNNFARNLKLFLEEHRPYKLTRMLYPNKRVLDYNDTRKLRRLANGVTRPTLDEVVTLSKGLGISPAKLCFGVWP